MDKVCRRLPLSRKQRTPRFGALAMAVADALREGRPYVSRRVTVVEERRYEL